MSPRVRGSFILLGAAFMVAFNLILAPRLGRYAPLLFPMAGAAVPLGVALLASGWSPEHFRRSKAILFLMTAGVLAGLLLNKVLFGSLW
jgi:hypothetical protein